MANFQCGNNNMPIESGCRRGVPRNLTICELCTKDIGDKFHYICNCPHFENLRNKLIQKTSQILTFISKILKVNECNKCKPIVQIMQVY